MPKIKDEDRLIRMGQYKGTKYKNVPLDYLMWISEVDNARLTGVFAQKEITRRLEAEMFIVVLKNSKTASRFTRGLIDRLREEHWEKRN